MIKCEALEPFTLRRFDELANIVRKGVDTPGQLNIGDVFVYTEMDEDGGHNCYFRIVELGDDNELFLLPSDDNGNLLDDLSEIDSDDFTSLNAYVKSNELFELVKEWTLMPVK